MLRCGFQLHFLDVLDFCIELPVGKGVNGAFDLTFKATYFLREITCCSA